MSERIHLVSRTQGSGIACDFLKIGTQHGSRLRRQFRVMTSVNGDETKTTDFCTVILLEPTYLLAFLRLVPSSDASNSARCCHCARDALLSVWHMQLTFCGNASRAVVPCRLGRIMYGSPKIPFLSTGGWQVGDPSRGADDDLDSP